MFLFFFFNDTATTEIYTLSLHDALPISGATLLRTRSTSASERSRSSSSRDIPAHSGSREAPLLGSSQGSRTSECLLRSEEHTSELQSRPHLVCRLLLEKKKKVSNQQFCH